jgi:hypothetical protein
MVLRDECVQNCCPGAVAAPPRDAKVLICRETPPGCLMDLIGVLSNHDLQGSLGRLAGKLATVRASGGPRRQAVGCRQRPRRPGWVLKAVVRVLADRGEPMRAKDIHAAVEASLGAPVAWSSVKAALAANVSGSSRRFVRIARGRYTLA